MQQLRMELGDASQDIGWTNKAFKQFDRQLEWSDFYQPSKEIKEYQMIFGGYVIRRLV